MGNRQINENSGNVKEDPINQHQPEMVLNTEGNDQVSSVQSIYFNIKRIKNYIENLEAEVPGYKIEKLLYVKNYIKKIQEMVSLIESKVLAYNNEVKKAFEDFIMCIIKNDTSSYDMALSGLTSAINK